jgi:hypothetical protein
MARSFLSYDDAVSFCRGKQLRNVELVVRMDDESELTMALARHLTVDEE